jgi:hypothetical protein
MPKVGNPSRIITATPLERVLMDGEKLVLLLEELQRKPKEGERKLTAELGPFINALMSSLSKDISLVRGSLQAVQVVVTQRNEGPEDIKF